MTADALDGDEVNHNLTEQSTCFGTSCFGSQQLTRVPSIRHCPPRQRPTLTHESRWDA